MRIVLALTLFVYLFPAVANASDPASDYIVTIDRKADDLAQGKDDCAPINTHTVCTYTSYHYEVDGHGRLYFVRVSAFGIKDLPDVKQPGAENLTFICQLNAGMVCENPETQNQTFDLNAYAVSTEGVNVHSLTHPWADPQKALLFLAQIKTNANAALQTNDQAQNRMMDDLVCYLFDFDEMAREFKTNGRLVEDRSIRRLRPDQCLTSFGKICADPGSRADELELAANVRAHQPARPKKFALSAADIRNFCKSLKGTKDAMLR